jgi:kynurenine formamidase
MCLAETLDHHHEHPVGERFDRRRLLRGGAAATAGAALAVASPLPAGATGAASGTGGAGAGAGGERSRRRRGRVVDLTHRLRRDFPTFTHDQPRDEVVTDYERDGYFTKRWTIGEHTGTHIDTPGHFLEGMRLVDQLEADELVAPVVVVDIRRKALDDPNAMVEPDDLIRFERRHGPIPHRALVCMDSGWAAKAGDPEAFLGGPAFPDYNFPGFSLEATDWLVTRRDPVGIAVDTASLDPGSSSTFDVHAGFLGSDRYGVEGLTNLDRIPPRGAGVFVGPIPWEDGSGSPCRVIATW